MAFFLGKSGKGNKYNFNLGLDYRISMFTGEYTYLHQCLASVVLKNKESHQSVLYTGIPLSFFHMLSFSDILPPHRK